ncbi:hypothetical protein An09g00040 [Aspergillus niger]|uniref:Uncharacterized protein n=2 Tax=Aspergillus niger TaxID=5061 RepID=A2QSX7_ASPNC|nr:hypothetical protein An09g00040 [Aspergillus niger]CAK45838.1 hypothetical protein An09g00040 [Aspergillus niger]
MVSIHAKLPDTDHSSDIAHPPATTGIRFWASRNSCCPIARKPRGLFGYGQDPGAGE